MLSNLYSVPISICKMMCEKLFVISLIGKHHLYINIHPNVRKSEHISHLEQKYNIVRRVHEFFQLLYVEGNSKVLL